MDAGLLPRRKAAHQKLPRPPAGVSLLMNPPPKKTTTGFGIFVGAYNFWQVTGGPIGKYNTAFNIDKLLSLQAIACYGADARDKCAEQCRNPVPFTDPDGVAAYKCEFDSNSAIRLQVCVCVLRASAHFVLCAAVTPGLAGGEVEGRGKNQRAASRYDYLFVVAASVCTLTVSLSSLSLPLAGSHTHCHPHTRKKTHQENFSFMVMP